MLDFALLRYRLSVVVWTGFRFTRVKVGGSGYSRPAPRGGTCPVQSIQEDGLV